MRYTVLFYVPVFIMILVSGCSRNDSGLPPNIIFIMADDIGYNDLVSYGQQLFPTPHTDQLAREGIRFTDAHSPSAVCSPTRYAVVTGTDPYRRYHTSHVLFNGEPLVIGKQEETVASLLKRAGYQTAVIGKWHLGLGDKRPRDLNNPGRGPNDIGFDYSFLVPDGHNMFPRYYIENGQIVGGTEPAFESKMHFAKRLGYKLLGGRETETGQWENRRPDSLISQTLAEKASAFIHSNEKVPFFLYYPTCAVHGPYKPGPAFKGRSGVSTYADFVMEFDWMVGRIMETLDSLGLSDNTLLIVTSDNGGLPKPKDGRGHDSTYPWRGKKQTAFEGGHRIPMICRWPGKIKAGSTGDQTISLVDLTATACALAGVTLNPRDALDSYNILPALLDETPGRTIRPYTVMGTRGTKELVLRQDQWKLIYTPEMDQEQLYKLDDDPGEENDLSGIRPEKTGELHDLLVKYMESGSSRPGAQGQGKSFEMYFRERDQHNQFLEENFQ